MEDSIKIIDPYDSYEFAPQESVSDNYGNSILESVQSLQVGFGTRVLRIDRGGLWLGAEDFASAPFSVDMDGNMVATSLDLSGYLQVGQALADVQSDIFDLSDIDTDLGVITAGTLIGLEVRGGLIRTSTSGARVEIDGTTDTLEIFDTSGDRRLMMDSDELIFYGTGGTRRGAVYATTADIYLENDNGGYVIINNVSTSYGTVFSIAGVTKASVTNAGLNVNDDIIAAAANIDIGSLTQPFENFYIDDIYLTSQGSNPSSNGMLRYYNSGGNEGLRCQFGGADFQFDATAV